MSVSSLYSECTGCSQQRHVALKLCINKISSCKLEVLAIRLLSGCVCMGYYVIEPWAAFSKPVLCVFFTFKRVRLALCFLRPALHVGLTVLMM